MKKILIVDDEKLLADVLSDYFEAKGWKVLVAYDLDQAKERYTPDCDLVLLDIKLEQGTSFPFLKQIKSDNPAQLVVMFSGHDDEEYIQQAKKLGADGFIPKPFNVEFLNEFLNTKIDQLCRKKGIS